MRRPTNVSGLYQHIYAVVHHIPPRQVATYGQIARVMGGCTPRTVGYAMAALPCDTDVPWHRVINSQGKISPRRSGEGGLRQRQLLEGEGIRFDQQGRVDLKVLGWAGPPQTGRRGRQ